MAKVIMIQGTMSNAGKSLLAAGLCRIFHQDGYRVAPFKSQNMALNSFITREGLEMGRAQVMQAEAAGIEPSVLMNPILLKPTNDTGSQVIVNGEVLGNMSAREYFSHKKELIPDIMKAYHALEEQYDIIVIEGTRIEGYEIHMGETVRKEGTEAFTFIDDQNRADSDKLDGAQKGNVYGTYVHGIFDKEEVAERIVEALAKNKGIAMEQIHGVDYQTFKETQYDILADALREHLDMKKIYQILEEGA